MDERVSSAASTNDGSTRSEAQAILDGQLPHYFGARAAQHQKSIVRGRHPVSIPKDSELWHYSKVATERRTKIMRGSSFWDVINDTAWQSHASSVLSDRSARKQATPQHMQMQSKREEQSISIQDVTDSEKTKLRGSLQSQLKAAMAAQNDLNVKLDMNKKGTINFGMTFIIMNFANEVIYMDKLGELRTKPLSEIQLTDRVKFKFVDLSNPSNPRAVKYGQNVWLQCLDPAENADNSLQSGSVLTTKLFGPPELESIHFADSYSKLISQDHHNAHSEQSARERNLQNLSQFTDKLQAKRRVSVSSINSAYADDHSAGGDRTDDEAEREEYGEAEAHEGYDDAGQSLANGLDENDLVHDAEGRGTDLDGLARPGEVSEQQRLLGENGNPLDILADDKPGHLHAKSKADNSEKARDTRSRQYRDSSSKETRRRFVDSSKAAMICGHVALNRIVEMRKEGGGHYAAEGFMSDEKALRYNSKQSMHMGKWSIQPARREDTINNFFDEEDTGGMNGSGANSSADYLRNFVSSLTPIVIQQDHYCLSTAAPVEYHHWPPNSSLIIRNSSLIQPDLAEEYEKRYAKALINNINTDHPTQLNSSTVNNHRHFENKKRLYFLTSSPFERNPTIQGRNAQGMRGAGAGGSGGGGDRSGQGGGAGGGGGRGGGRSGGNGHGHSPGREPGRSEATRMNPIHEHQFGCVRKIVHRSAPYDFIVDRRCVWKICLFEQFAESYVAMTNKEKQVQKVMETATMALKLSKMNREGARKHMNQCHMKISYRATATPSLAGSGSLHGGDLHASLDTNSSLSLASSSLQGPASSTASLMSELPPLLGGESFSRTIREITFKTSQFAGDVFMQDRRQKEARLTEYFADKIQMVISAEKSRTTSPRRSMTLSSSHWDNASSVGSLSTHGGRSTFSPTGASTGRRKTVKFFATEEDEDEEGGDNLRRDSWDMSAARELTEASLASLSKQGRTTELAPTSPPATSRGKGLLLISAKNVADFRELSAGEQLLSMHKTFGHFSKAAMVNTVQSRKKSTFSRPKALSTGVLKKMEMLKQQDELIDTILTCKERMRRRVDDEVARASVEEEDEEEES